MSIRFLNQFSLLKPHKLLNLQAKPSTLLTCRSIHSATLPRLSVRSANCFKFPRNNLRSSFHTKRNYSYYEPPVFKWRTVALAGTTALVSSWLFYNIFPLLFLTKPLEVLNASPHKVLMVLIATNVFVWFKGYMGKVGKIPRLYYLGTGAQFNIQSMFLSAFNHASLAHLAVNMFVLYGFGSDMIQVLGPASFLTLYFSATAWSSFFSVLIRTLAGTSSLSVGASGAVFGVVNSFAQCFPSSRIALYFIPMPITIGPFMTIVFGATTLLALATATNRTPSILSNSIIDHGGHLGGMIYGWVYIRYIAPRMHEQFFVPYMREQERQRLASFE
ncbi:hypothetical protein CANCADRAFT_1608 [Tortispora caseinolytica NRRL Y-17796]|uniref:Peptidase S54 rhomboid domain-containing protein n=1 Tax=Tortispora caseinolytica NRRL Y-17796 TaxID=767744 RepID=A0A1E4TDP8_9ASCO|nr:hypothetical protein CANCADRAFT_1608 [Tortispora caseinolytica NRRL Y-17796]